MHPPRCDAHMVLAPGAEPGETAVTAWPAPAAEFAAHSVQGDYPAVNVT